MRRTPDDWTRVRAILFDLGGTLDAPGTDWPTRFHRFFRAEGVRISYPRFRQVSEAVLAAFAARSEVHGWRLGPAIGHNVQEMSERLGLRSPARRRRVARRMVGDLMRNARKARPVLAALSRRGYRLGLISNNVGNTVPVLRDEGLLRYFETVLDSTLEGVRKPEAEIFHRALRRLRLPPEEAVYVGDTFACDVVGPKRAGMRAVWLVGDLRKPCPDPSLPDLTIRRLSDLLRHFAGPARNGDAER